MLLFCLLANLVEAQTGAYSVKGVVVDSLSREGEPYATIRIYLKNEPKEPVKLAAADLDGKFEADLPSASEYILYITSIGKKTISRAFATTPAQKRVILRLKYETPEDMKISGIEYYMAVLRDGVQNFDEFCRWRQQHPQQGIITWMP